MDDRSRYRLFEEQFLQQLRARARGLLGRTLPADGVQFEALPDGMDGVRATLMRLQRFERGLLEQLPGTQAVQGRFARRVFGPFHRTVARLRAQVLTPLDALLQGTAPGPVGRDAVLDALARYDLLPQRERPTAAVFASPTGFTPEARALVHSQAGLTLVLLGGREDGGWDVELPERLRRTPWAQLFDLESHGERLKRLLYHLEQSAAELDSRGLALPELADRLGLPTAQVETLVRQACRQDPRLLTVVHDGTVHVSRSPFAEESASMNLRTWFRKLLRLKPTVGERVRQMTAQRVQLEQQRYELDRRVDALEAEERAAIEKGAAAKTDVERKQLAGKLVRVRRDLRRVRSQAEVFTKQIDILGTHIHHLALAEQGKRVTLPSAAELTQEAAQAEQMMRELAMNADLATGIEVGASSPLGDDEEAAIMAEFRQAAADAAPDAIGTEPARQSAPDGRVPESPSRAAADRGGGAERAPDPNQRGAERA